jgi:hypothetical protein
MPMLGQRFMHDYKNYVEPKFCKCEIWDEEFKNGPVKDFHERSKINMDTPTGSCADTQCLTKELINTDREKYKEPKFGFCSFFCAQSHSRPWFRMVSISLYPVWLLLIAGVATYRVLRPCLGPARCRFHPSCSTYAWIILKKEPSLASIFKIFRRILRCHPWNEGGIDWPS